MTKRLELVPAAILGLMLSAVPVSAAAISSTTHVSTLSVVIPVTCAGVFVGASDIEATGNGVIHFNVNSTGDWFTETFAGNGTLTDFNSGITWQGHFTEWDGAAGNLQNTVHAILAFHGTNVADASQTLNFEAHVDMTVNANGVPTAMSMAANCH
jgi:hypothetical protein